MTRMPGRMFLLGIITKRGILRKVKWKGINNEKSN